MLRSEFSAGLGWGQGEDKECLGGDEFHGIPFKALATGGLAMGSITKGLEQNKWPNKHKDPKNSRWPRLLQKHRDNLVRNLTKPH